MSPYFVKNRRKTTLQNESIISMKNYLVECIFLIASLLLAIFLALKSELKQKMLYTTIPDFQNLNLKLII